MLPSESGLEGGSRAFHFFLAFSRLSLGTPPPPAPALTLWRRRRTFLWPVPAGAARVIPPGRGRLSLPKESRWGIAARLSARSLWSVLVRKCEVGQHLTPSGPWHSPPARSSGFPPGGRPLARQSHARLVKNVRLLPGFGTKSLPPGAATPLNCSFQPPSRGAGLACWSGRRAFLWRRKVSANTCVTLQSLKRLSLSLQALGEWVPSLVELTKRVQRAPNAKATILPPSQGLLLPSGLSLFCSNLRVSSSLGSLAEPRAPGSGGEQKPDGWRLQAAATLGWGKPRCPRPSSPPAKWQVCLSTLWVRFSSIHIRRQASLSHTSPSEILRKKKKKNPNCEIPAAPQVGLSSLCFLDPTCCCLDRDQV